MTRTTVTRTVLVYGDSNTHGTPPMPHLDFEGRHPPADRWPDVLADALPDWTVIYFDQQKFFEKPFEDYKLI